MMTRIVVIESWDDPNKQVVLKALKSGSLEEAQRIQSKSRTQLNVPSYWAEQARKRKKINVKKSSPL